MTKKDVQQALESDSIARLWECVKDMSAKLEGALFKKDVEPYIKLMFGIVTVILSAVTVAILKLIIK